MNSNTTKNNKEPIAIIGIGCRFPHGANTPESFWEMLCAGTDVITEIPPDRWNLESFYDPDPATPGMMQIRHGGFLEQIDHFDASFFGYSPREANSLDPQQRLLLEVVWEALENGGLVPEKLAGTRTGVFIGGFPMDYKLLVHSEMQRELIGLHTVAGAATTMLANRISHWYDFRGPSISLDTACSSSLITAYLACQSLWTGASDLAVAGGVNAIFKPEWTIAVSKAGFLSPDGRCKSFDARANGYVRGEGAGIVILKPLSQALAAGDRIYAVIRSASANQDGHTPGITVPSEAAQIALMTEAYEQAGIVPGQVQYVEAHGTGTLVGDPIEANAIGKVLSTGRPAHQSCMMGSIKTNIGHTEAAAGVAGLIKVALCLYYSKIPPNIHFETPNPAIPFEALQLKVPTTIESFPEGTRFAGVNSFGFGGANAHLVLQNADDSNQPIQDEQKQNTRILPISARSKEALKEIAKSYHDLLTEESTHQIAFDDLCYNAALRRGHHNHRLALVANAKPELIECLAAFLNDDKQLGVVTGHLEARDSKTAFVFSGMGPQWWAMGRELLQAEPVFQDMIKRCDQLLGQYTDWSLWHELLAEEEVSRIQETQIAQPAIFAIQVALAALWDSWGVRPDVIMGHSVGEVAAAYVAGALNLADAVRVIYNRSHLQHQTEGQGKMLAVGLPPTEAEQFLKGDEDSVSIAAVNSPSAVTLAGDAAVLERIRQQLEQQDVFCRFLKVNVPYHSPKMEPLKPALITALQGIQPKPATIPICSTVSGKMINGEEFTPHYWANNMRKPVLFAAAIKELMQTGCQVFVELSAHPVLASSIAECLSAEVQAIVLPSLRRKEPELPMMMNSFARLYTAGYPVDWNLFYPQPGRFVQLPLYPWQRERYWTESDESREYRLGGASRRTVMGQTVHHLLGSRLETAQPIWNVEIGRQRHLRYLDDHKIQGSIVYPGAAYVEMALAAALEIFGKPCTLENIVFKKALFLSEKTSLQLSFDPALNIFGIYSQNAPQDWIQHTRGKIIPAVWESNVSVKREEIQNRCAKTITGPDCYLQLHKMGLEYGPAFQAIQEVWSGDREIVGKLAFADELQIQDYQLHPSILDACFQVFTAILAFSDEPLNVYLPVGIDRLRVDNHAESVLWVHAHIIEQSSDYLKGNILLFAESGQIVADIKGFSCKALEKNQDKPLAAVSESLYEYQWALKALETESVVNKPGTWLIFADNEGIGQEIAGQLTDRGESTVIVTAGEAWLSSESGHFQIRPDSLDDMTELFNTVSTMDLPAWRGILHLWSLDTESVSFEEANQLTCTSVLNLLKVFSDHKMHPHLYLITKGSQVVDKEASVSVMQSPLWGIGRVIGNEHPEFKTTLIDMEASQPDITALMAELWNNDGEDEVAFRQGNRYVHRLAPLASDDFQPVRRQSQSAAGQPFYLENATPGKLTGLVLRSATRTQPGLGEVEIEVYAASLHVKDVAKVLNQVDDVDDHSNRRSVGMACAGKITALGEDIEGYQIGYEVIAFADHCFRSFTVADVRLVVPKPTPLSFEQAAAIPLVFLTAYYGLDYLARMREGDSVLIHSATDGIGLAAIELAKRKGATIFATADTPAKRDFLTSVGLAQVMDSGSLSFADEVMAATQGSGVDIILNSLTGEAFSKNFALLAPHGRLIEIGKPDANTQLALRHFQKNRAFWVLELESLLKAQTELASQLFREMMALFANDNPDGLPLPPCQVFPISQVTDAFSLMAGGEQMGNIVITMQDPKTLVVPANTKLADNQTVLISGGLSGFGLATAQWLTEQQGVQNLVLMGRSGASSEQAKETLERMTQNGIHVKVAKADVSDPEQVANALSDIRQTMPPLTGIIHAANVYDDAMLNQIEPDNLQRVMNPKALGAWHLHSQTLNDPLKFFVLFSSVTAIIGNPGQGSYAAANAFLDSLAVYRRQVLNLPALSINWGGLSDVGYLAIHADVKEHMEKIGLEFLSAETALNALGELLHLETVNVTISRMDWTKWAKHHEAAKRPRFSRLVSEDTGSEHTRKVEFLEALKAVALEERQAVLESQITGLVIQVLGLSRNKQIAPTQGFLEMGMDSMLSMELRNLLQTAFACRLPTVFILKYPNVNAITGYFMKEVFPELFSSEVPNTSLVAEPEMDDEGVEGEI